MRETLLCFTIFSKVIASQERGGERRGAAMCIHVERFWPRLLSKTKDVHYICIQRSLLSLVHDARSRLEDRVYNSL